MHIINGINSGIQSFERILGTGPIQRADTSADVTLEEVLAAVTENGFALRDYPRFWQHRNVVLAAVGQTGSALRSASDLFKDDENLVLTAVTQNGQALRFASEKLKGNKDIVIAACRQSGICLHYASKEIRSTKEVVKVAVCQSGEALRYASEDLRGDRDLVLLAVNQNGYALQYACEEHRGDKEIVIRALNNKGCLAHASDALRNDLEVVGLAMKKCRYAYTYALCDVSLQKERAALENKERQLGGTSASLHGSSKEQKQEIGVSPTSLPIKASSVTEQDPIVVTNPVPSIDPVQERTWLQKASAVAVVGLGLFTAYKILAKKRS
jgi:hypothetical protein